MISEILPFVRWILTIMAKAIVGLLLVVATTILLGKCAAFSTAAPLRLVPTATPVPFICSAKYEQHLSGVSTQKFSLALPRTLGLCSSLVILFSGVVPSSLALTPDLAGTPLEKANPAIVVEGPARIVDGDTLVIETSTGQKERIRLLGIDAPESKQLCQDNTGAGYACGVEAKQSLEKIVGRDPVKCLAAKRDQYSRVLGVCFDAKTGQELNKELVVEGEAVAYQQYSKAYVNVEEGARRQSRGVWKGKFQKPWDYRKERRSAQQIKAKQVTAAVVDDADAEQ